MTARDTRAATSARALLGLIRVRTGVAGAVLCIAGIRLSGDDATGTAVVAVVVSIALLISFAQVVNDIIDRDLDRMDKPHRPLPSGDVTVRGATAVAIGCAVGALATAAIVSASHVLFAAVLLALSWAYSWAWKSTVLWGNVVVATLASSSVSYGAIAAGGITPRTVAVQAIVLCFGLAFEVLKDAVDLRGDQASGVRTLATRHGVRSAALLTAVLCVVSSALAVTPALLTDARSYLALTCAFFVAPILVSAVMLVRRGRTVDDLKIPYQLMRMAWRAGVFVPLLL